MILVPFLFVGAVLLVAFYILVSGKTQSLGVTSHELNSKSERTYIIRLADRWIRMLRRCCGRSRIDRFFSMLLTDEFLISLAKKDTGLSDFGPDFAPSQAALRVLLKSLQQEAHLTPVGQFFLAHRLRGALCNRLRAEELFKRHPEILQEDISDPLVITGLPRTGTTLVHRLLALEPNLRPLSLWEALNPAPESNFDPTMYTTKRLSKRRQNCSGFWCWIWNKILGAIGWKSNSRIDPRLDEAHQYTFVFKYVAPNAFTIHPCDLDAPEEEAVIMDMSFMSQLSEALYRVPAFASWLEKQDPLPMYLFLKKMLQLLHWQSPGLGKKCRWLLKTPNHLEWLDTFFTVFPNAQIIHTHRPPMECLTSAFSASCHARRLFSDDVDANEVARHWLRKDIRMLSRGMSIRKEMENAITKKNQQYEEFSEEKIDEPYFKVPFIDIEYKNLLKDPIGQLKIIYQFAGLSLGKETEDSVHQHLIEENIQKKYGRHEYRLVDFGLEPRDLHDASFDLYSPTVSS